MTVYSPPVNTYTPLASITLAADAAAVTFTGFSQDYRDLVLVCNSKPTGTGGKDLVMQFNGDTGNATRVLMYGDGSSAVSTTASNLIAQYNDQTNFEVGISQIMDYSATDKHKTVLTRNNDSGIVVAAQAQRWASTSAITTINLAYSVDIATGSSFKLFGIKA